MLSMIHVHEARWSPECIPIEMFPDVVAVEQIDPIDAEISLLHPEEAAMVSGACTKRQMEFAAGRICAHRAFAKLGMPQSALLIRSDRRPAWPSGAVGSISHTSGCCIAAVARTGVVSQIGVDVELSIPLPEEVWDKVLTLHERQQLHRFPEKIRGLQARLLFSAKEALYKCIRIEGTEWLGFLDVEFLRFDDDKMDLLARINRKLFEGNHYVLGRYALTSKFIFTAFTMGPR